MRTFQIQDKKTFMTKLLMDTTFDAFLLSEASITTYATFQIDGTFHPEFLSREEQDRLADEKSGYTLWKRVRPFFFDLTKGKNTPLRFRIVLRLAPRNVDKLLAQNGLQIPGEQISGLFMNIQFDGSSLICTSGVSLQVFSLDRTLEYTWDDNLERFFRQTQIPFLS